MKFELVEETPTCDARRGNRGKVACEMPVGHEDDYHMGRGRDGRWISWRRLDHVDGDKR